MKTTVLTVLTMAAAALLLGGCGRDQAPPPAGTGEAPAAPAQTAAPAQVAAPAPAAESTGVPECDEYFRQAELCFTHNVMMKARLEEGLPELRATLTRSAQTPENRERMASQCKAHTEVLLNDCKI